MRLGSLGRRLQLFQLSLELPNLEVTVDSLRVTSSILSSEASNLVTLIATGVTVRVLDSSLQQVEEEAGREESSQPPKGKSTRTLLLLAQFLGVQVREVKVVLCRLPAFPDCRLVTELGELRLDSSVIHRTRLSLALFLYQGSVSVLRGSSKPLLEANFAFQASIQALVGAGRISSVEDVNLDIDGLSVRVLSSLFQYSQLARRPSQPGGSGLTSYAAFIPKVCQVKAEAVSGQLEHTDGVSQLSGELSLLYLCGKCTEVPRAGLLPDSHFTSQLAGLRVCPGQQMDGPAFNRSPLT